jgi:hypothetical protein
MAKAFKRFLLFGFDYHSQCGAFNDFIASSDTSDDIVKSILKLRDCKHKDEPTLYGDDIYENYMIVDIAESKRLDFYVYPTMAGNYNVTVEDWFDIEEAEEQANVSPR